MRSRAVLYCLTLALSVGSVVAVASPISYTFVGTQQPSDAHNNTGPSSFDGINCTGLGSSRLDGRPCIISPDGNPHTYQPFYAKIFGDPTTGVWNLEIQTNAPLDYGDSASKLAFGDALLKGGGPAPATDPLYWGISIGSGQAEAVNTGLPGAPGASTTAGDLYEVGTFGNGHPRFSYDAMYLTQVQLFGVSNAGRGFEPVWINPNPGDTFGNPFMSDVSDPKKTAFNIATPGCASATPGGAVDQFDVNCGHSFQLYTITDTFTAPQAFSDMLASGVFSFEFSSFICANGMIIGNGSSVPEPRAVSFFALGILLLGYRLTRWRKAQVS